MTWEPGRAVATNRLAGADDGVIVDAIVGSDKAGIDCPLGWPVDFVTFLIAHWAAQQLSAGAATGRDLRRWLTTRETDRVVRAETHLILLSVAADRIAHVAMRCAELLAQLARNVQHVDRTGTGTVVEVYPAASLAGWGRPHRGYKGNNGAAVLDQLVDGVLSKAAWLVLGDYEDKCRTSDDAADAVIAALTARDRRGPHQGTRQDTGDFRQDGGWIATPTSASLGNLL